MLASLAPSDGAHFSADRKNNNLQIRREEIRDYPKENTVTESSATQRSEQADAMVVPEGS